MAGLMPADPARWQNQGDDFQGFSKAIAQICDWTLSADVSSGRFSWRLSSIELTAPDPRGASIVSLSRLFSSPGVFRIAANHPSDILIVAPLKGRLDLFNNGRAVSIDQGQALVCQAGTLTGLAHAGQDGDQGLGLIRLNLQSVERILFDPLHLPIDPDLQMSATIDAGSAETGGLFAMISGFWSREFIEQRQRPTPRLQRNLIDGLSLLLLEAIPHRYSERVMRPSVGPLPAYVRHARASMHSAEGNSFTIADLAARAGVSVRTLELGFRTYLNITPAAYLRGVRLRKAHAILKVRADTRSVADIGKACGLPHAGRFADYYLQLFGETPSETRRRGE